MFLLKAGYSRLVAASVALGDPVLLETPIKGTTTTNTIDSGTLAPNANDLILAALVSRGSASVTHSTPTDGTLDLGSWTNIESFTVDDGTGWVHGSLWWAMASGTPGTGVITIGQSGNTNQRILACMRVPGANVSPIERSEVATHTTGTSIQTTLDATPATSALGIAILGCRTADLTNTPDAGFTTLYEDVASSGALQVAIHYDRLSPPQAFQVAGLASPTGRGLIYAAISD